MQNLADETKTENEAETDDLVVAGEDLSDSDTNEPFIEYNIASYPSDLTLSVINEMWKSGDIVIPDFQRNYVWSIKQASLLVESFLMGLPVPQIFFYVDSENRSQVIDGQQRLTSIVQFLDGYFGTESIHGKKQVFRLAGLSNESPYKGKSFEELGEVHQRKFKNAVLRAINIRQLNPTGEATSVYHIFERLNTGGTPLKPQEIRNCVFRGEFAQILNRLNSDINWRKILGKKTFDRHQKDVELILRIFSLTYYIATYSKPMKEFFNIVMNAERKGDSQNVRLFIEKFLSVSNTLVETIGERPFHVRGPLNSSVLDAVYVVLLTHSGPFPNDLKRRYEDLIKDVRFREATYYSTSDTAVLVRRLELANQILLT